MINLTQKERLLLEDQKGHEELCVKKYNDYASKAQDPVLKQLFTSHAQSEQQHLNTINQILSGQVPSMGQGQQQGTSNSSTMSSQTSSQSDADLCRDLLATEKFVSSTYDTTIFECTQKSIRNALNHIQKEEQEHGEAIYNYMASNGMYNVK